ncbi:MAG: tRNA-binding protein [Chitinophagaceae bacterium]|nr:MAG: tRNA-binding protein [Chitinophagaceae bacterium]
MDFISWSDFEKIDIRSGTIITVKDFPQARKPAYQLWIDFGEIIGIKKSSAQITNHYTKEALQDKKILAVVNFAPKQIGGFISECLVLGIYDENNAVILLEPNLPVSNGQKIG